MVRGSEILQRRRNCEQQSNCEDDIRPSKIRTGWIHRRYIGSQFTILDPTVFSPNSLG
jgi:hypothetical protein